jgi:hypothetical protein
MMRLARHSSDFRRPPEAAMLACIGNVANPRKLGAVGDEGVLEISYLLTPVIGGDDDGQRATIDAVY